MALGCCHRSEPSADRFQFSLRELLALTTFAAIAAAVAAVKGPGVFVSAAGLGICYLNHRGALARWQQGKRPWLWLGVAYLLFVVSFAAHAVDIEYFVEGAKASGFIELRGWEAAWYNLLTAVDEWSKRSASWRWGIGILWTSLLNLANLLLILSPFWAWRLSTGHGSSYGTLAAVSAAAVWCGAVCFQAHSGYYLWALANLTLLSAWRVRRTALIGMALTVGFFLAVA